MGRFYIRNIIKESVNRMNNTFYRKLLNTICGSRYSEILPDKIFLKMLSRVRLNRKLNLSNPETFNDKLQWLKLYDRNPLYTKLVDKYEVREYIADTIGKEYLIPIIGVYNEFSEINFNDLPEKFVLKCTHDSGGVSIITNKDDLNYQLLKTKFEELLRRNYYYTKREWPYKNIKPRIICEKYMVDESGKELKDYKLFCFNGEPRLIQVDYDRFVNHKRNMYDSDWNFIPFSNQYPSDSNVAIKEPLQLNNMLDLARILAKDYPHVRVDFYSIDEKIYFGEMTFFHESGFAKFSPEKYDYILGSWLKLPKEIRN